MHWLTGSAKKELLHKMWRTVGALNDSVQIHYSEPFIEYDYQGTPIRFYRDVDTTEKHLTSLSPTDAKEIKALCNNIRKVKNLAMPITDLPGIKVTKKTRPSVSLLFSAISAMRIMRSFSKISRDEYVSRFTHEGLREMLRALTNEKTGVVPLFFTMGTLARGDGGFPEGGSLPFVGRIVNTFHSLGGELLLNTRGERIIIKNNKAVGVMVDGKNMPADAVIITSDTMSIDGLFDTPPKASWLEEMHTVTEPTMATFLSLGIKTDLKKHQKTLVFKLQQPIFLAEQKYEYLSVYNYASDPAYSPEGKAAITIVLGGNTYDFWKKTKEENRYLDKKHKLAGVVIEALSELIPEIKGQVEVCDVATPLTYERYCNNWKGSWMTEMTPSMKMKSSPAAINELSGVYFAGQRMMPPGGLPVALMTGRTAVQYLCRDTGTLFASE